MILSYKPFYVTTDYYQGSLHTSSTHQSDCLPITNRDTPRKEHEVRQTKERDTETKPKQSDHNQSVPSPDYIHFAFRHTWAEKACMYDTLRVQLEIIRLNPTLLQLS